MKYLVRSPLLRFPFLHFESTSNVLITTIGSVLLLANLRNEPLGLRNTPARASHSSLPSQYQSPSPAPSRRQVKRAHSDVASKKKTSDGTIVLEPQPEDSDNDPLNWPAWRRDSALLSLGLYCMVGGGMTSVLAAGFTDVAETYNVSVPEVALTTGLYMMGLGVGSVFASPTAILYGKRPVYLAGCVLFVATSVWCAASPSYPSLVTARVLQGMSVSPVECLPSATIAEIFFLHERAYRIGIYTLLLLGGKNLVPLVSAAIIEGLDWRWVFWYVIPTLRALISVLTSSGLLLWLLDFAGCLSSFSSQRHFGTARRALEVGRCRGSRASSRCTTVWLALTGRN